MKNLHGFTLVELLVAITVFGILAALAADAYHFLHMHAQATEASSRINHVTRLARHLALQKGKTMAVCPSSSGNACGGSWSDELVVFSTRHNSWAFTDTDVVHRQPAIRHGTTTWRAFRTSSGLQFNSKGVTMGYNGTFIYCPKNNDARFGRGLVLNKSGRLRLLQDTDGDGIVNLKPGENIRCPQ